MLMLFFSWLNYWSSTLKINLSLLQNSYANPNAFLQLNERIGDLNLKISKYIKLCVRSVPVSPKDCVSPQDYVSPAFSMYGPKFS